ncbi:acyl-CoA N-acyltransferase, partial [Rhizodiscina lignyota]
ITIRPARLEDLDHLTYIGIHAFPLEPQWGYRYPFSKSFSEDHWKYTRERYREWLEAARMPQCEIMVAENTDPHDPTITKVVGLSIWRLPGRVPPTAKPRRRDADPIHMAVYRASVGYAQAEYFDKMYGSAQLSLAQLATNPKYFRNGVASMLLNWGLDLARKRQLPITLFANPNARELYQRFGFVTVVTVVTTVSGEEEKI